MIALRTRHLLALLLLAACREGSGPGFGPPATIETVSAGALTGTVGTVIATPITFRVTDARANPVSGATVHFTTTGGGMVSPASAQTDAEGEASTQLTLGTLATTIVVNAGTTGVSPSAQFAVTATPGPASKLRFVVEPSPSFPDLEILPPVQVVIEDTFGNALNSAANTISIALGSNPGAATLAGVTSTTATGGNASFSTLKLNQAGTGYTLTATAEGLTEATSGAFNVTGPGRADSDRPDDVSGAQVHIFYVIPSDGTDRRLDVNGTLARSVASFDRWFIQHSAGLAFRFDNHNGELDVTFFRLTRTNDEMKALGGGVGPNIELQLSNAGKLRSGKQYIVYYDGGSTYACGGAAWPPNVPGQVASMYLQGAPPGASCASVGFVASATSFPGYWEFAALHDLIHTLGVVSRDAPHHTTAYPAHVPERNDLMYSGPESWILSSTTAIDLGGDDYYGPSVPAGIATLTGNPIFVSVVAALSPQLRAQSESEAAELAGLMAKLPVHPPFRSPPPR